MNNKLHSALFTSRFNRLCLITTLLLGLSAFAQDQAASQPGTTSVPNFIRYSGTLKNVQGAALVAPTTVGVTFSVYKQQDGGAAVWHETQNIRPDASGHYSVLLGSGNGSGLPDDLFSSQEQRWLGVQLQGQEEQPRVLMVSVPYALKAHEAETLGGLPASAFLKAAPSQASNGTSVNALTTVTTSGAASAGMVQPPTTCTGCSASYLPVLTDGLGDLANSTIYQDASKNLGIGTTYTQSGYKVKIYDLSWPNLTLSGPLGTGGQSANGVLAVASCAGCFAVRAKPGDFILSAAGGGTGSLILEANDYNNASIQFATGTTGNGDTKMTLTPTGNLGVGVVNPTSAFAVGDWTTSHNTNPPAAPFQVTSAGDVVKIKNVAYSWPASQAPANTVLTNDGTGNLSWGPANNSGVGGGCSSGSGNFATWTSKNTVGCVTNLSDNGSGLNVTGYLAASGGFSAYGNAG